MYTQIQIYIQILIFLTTFRMVWSGTIQPNVHKELILNQVGKSDGMAHRMCAASAFVP